MSSRRKIGKSELAIGEVATRSAVPASTLRYYEELGLVSASRRVGGKRRYDPSVFERLEMISLAQKAGLALDEIRTLLEAMDGGTAATRKLQSIAKVHIPEVEAAIERYRLMLALLNAAARCKCPSLSTCVDRAKKAGVVSRPP